MKNKRFLWAIRFLAALVTILSVYFFAPWEFALHYLSPLPETVQQELDDAVERRFDGIIVYIDKKGQKPQYYASGWHDRAQKIPANPNALFKIASIAKLYDATAVAKLVASDTLALDGKLVDYLPELKGRIQYADQITIKMMVQHRSGIPNFTDQESFDWGSSTLKPLELVLDLPADFPPDSDYRYSNTNYLLLQRIMSRVLGYDYTDYIRAEILAPLGLTHTFFSINEVDREQVMSGYFVGYEQDFKSLDQGYVATAQDVGVFLRALNDGSLLSPKEQGIYSSIYKYEHTGWVLGYLSIAKYHPDLDTVVIQFVNTNGDDTVMLSNIVYGRIIDILNEQQKTN